MKSIPSRMKHKILFTCFGALIIAIAAVLAWVTTLAFRGILKSIDTLNNLPSSSKRIRILKKFRCPQTPVWLQRTSDQFEVPQLISALTSYKEALLSNRAGQSRKSRTKKAARRNHCAKKCGCWQIKWKAKRKKDAA